jgi:hypothetical protein
MNLIQTSIPMFDTHYSLAPIDARMVLALLQIGLEESGQTWPESTEADFYDALIEIPHAGTHIGTCRGQSGYRHTEFA